MAHKAVNSPFFSPPQLLFFFPANGSPLFCDIKPQLISALSRMHLWLRKETQIPIHLMERHVSQQTKDFHNDNLDYHSNTIGALLMALATEPDGLGFTGFI